MADAPAVDLSYGHFGTPLYDPEAKHWIFQRRPRKHQLLISLASSKVFPSANTHQAETEILDTIGAKALGHHIKTLARNNPELAPALELLPDLAKVSASIVSVVSTYNPAVGDLLAFGRNDDIDTERARARYRIAATPYGETGNILRITHVREDQYGWGHDKGVWLNVPCLHEETSWSGWWPGSGAPIQQICFGDSDGSASFMAVRMPTETIIFRPLFRSTPVQTGTSQSPRLPPSRLDPNPVLHIPISKTGRLPQADVCFNPWFPRQLAFVDEEGSWSVWDLEGQARRINNYCVSPFCFGTIVPPKSVEAIPDEAMPEFDEPSGSPEDGWARILWIGDVNTIVVCNRRHMAVFVINGGKEKARRLKCPELGFARTASWILDIRRSPQNQNRFFVLTSTMLHLVEIRFQDVGLGRSSSESEAIVLLSWRHFRGAEDVSLQMRLCQARAEGIIVSQCIWEKLD
jgi:RNA polymerase I-specific transcription initiation factor RRN6